MAKDFTQDDLTQMQRELGSIQWRLSRIVMREKNLPARSYCEQAGRAIDTVKFVIGMAKTYLPKKPKKRPKRK